MPSFISFDASTRSPQAVADILRDDLALDRVRFWRRIIAARFGLLALMAFVAGRVVPGLSAYGRWVPVLLFLAPPAWAWLAELRLTLRLSQRVPAPGSASTCTVLMESTSGEANW